MLVHQRVWCMLLSWFLPFCIAQNQRNNIIHLNACIMIVTPTKGFKGLVQWHMMALFTYHKLGTQNEDTVDLILNQDFVGYNHPGIKDRWMKLVDRTSLNGIFMGIFYTGWWYTYPSEKYDFVSWDDEIPNIWKHKIPWFQSPPTSTGYIANYNQQL